MVLTGRKTKRWRWMALGVLLAGFYAHAEVPPIETDPMVRITAPPALRVEVDAVLEGLSQDVSRDTGLDQSLLTYYWQVFDAIHCMGEKVNDYPLFVDLYVPGFMTDEEVGRVMQSIAASLEKRTDVAAKWIFIHTHTAQPGRVMLNGEIQDFADGGLKGGGEEPEVTGADAAATPPADGDASASPWTVFVGTLSPAQRTALRKALDVTP